MEKSRIDFEKKMKDITNDAKKNKNTVRYEDLTAVFGELAKDSEILDKIFERLESEQGNPKQDKGNANRDFTCFGE